MILYVCHSLPLVGRVSAGVSTDDIGDAGTWHQPVRLGAVEVLQLEVEQSRCHFHIGTNPGHHDVDNLLQSKMSAD